jgi:hypothetical protein
VIEQRLRVKDGRFVLPDGMSYRLLVLPELDSMRPELLAKIRELVKAGGAVLGPPPSRSPSMQGYPECDTRVKKLADELWGQLAEASAVNSSRTTHHATGKGRVFRSSELQPVLDELGIPPDFGGADPKKILATHRSSREADIYFLSNQGEQATAITPVFRVSSKLPEFWDAASGRVVKAAAFEQTASGMRVPLELGPRGSLFVLFREPVGKLPAVTQATRDGEVVLTTAARGAPSAAATDNRTAVNSFTMAGWVKPAVDIGLPAETNSGVFLHLARNDAVFPVHGESAFADPTHACAGISAGRNGVCVYEHSGSYFAPLLVYAAPLTNWTHVAIVYEGGTPSLYLNGALTHRGVQSQFKVHSGFSVDPAGGSVFKGQVSGLGDFGRALTAAEVAELAKSKPPGDSGASLSAIALSQAGHGRLEAEVQASGNYELKLSNGRTCAFRADGLPAPLELSGPWDVRLPANLDVPAHLALEKLTSLTEHPNEAVKYFSGTATYERTFDLPADQLGAGKGLLLDLGRVEAMAEVLLNGQDLGVLWKPPFVIDISGAAKPGANRLEVRVTGTWRNRLIGDTKYPSGFPGSGSASGTQQQFKPYLGVGLKLNRDEAPAPFGLIGPVQVRSIQRVRLSP